MVKVVDVEKVGHCTIKHIELGSIHYDDTRFVVFHGKKALYSGNSLSESIQYAQRHSKCKTGK